MNRFLLVFATILLISCSSKQDETSSATSNDSMAVPVIEQKMVNHQSIDTIVSRNESIGSDTLPDYETFEEYLTLFKTSQLPASYDSMYLEKFKANSSSRLRFSRFFHLNSLTEPEGMNAFYAGNKFELGNGKTAVTILTDVAPEIVGTDGILKTVNVIVYDKTGNILSEQTLFRFYAVFMTTESSWGELSKDLKIHRHYYNSEVDEDNHEIVDKGSEVLPLCIK